MIKIIDFKIFPFVLFNGYNLVNTYFVVNTNESINRVNSIIITAYSTFFSSYFLSFLNQDLICFSLFHHKIEFICKRKFLSNTKCSKLVIQPHFHSILSFLIVF